MEGVLAQHVAVVPGRHAAALREFAGVKGLIVT